jgi:hypothetical protein
VEKRNNAALEFPTVNDQPANLQLPTPGATEPTPGQSPAPPREIVAAPAPPSTASKMNNSLTPSVRFPTKLGFVRIPIAALQSLRSAPATNSASLALATAESRAVAAADSGFDAPLVRQAQLLITNGYLFLLLLVLLLLIYAVWREWRKWQARRTRRQLIWEET